MERSTGGIRQVQPCQQFLAARISPDRIAEIGFTFADANRFWSNAFVSHSTPRPYFFDAASCSIARISAAVAGLTPPPQRRHDLRLRAPQACQPRRRSSASASCLRHRRHRRRARADRSASCRWHRRARDWLPSPEGNAPGPSGPPAPLRGEPTCLLCPEADVGDPHGVGSRAGDLSIHIGAVLDHQIQKRGIRRTAASAGHPESTPAATRNGVKPMALMLGLAPLARSARMTSMSPAWVARNKGVHPVLNCSVRKASAIAAAAGAMHVELRIQIDIRGQQPVDDVHTEEHRRSPSREQLRQPRVHRLRGLPLHLARRRRIPFYRRRCRGPCVPTNPRHADSRHDPTAVWRRRYDRYRGRPSAA